MVVQEFFHDFEARGVVKSWSSVRSAVHDVERGLQAVSLVRSMEFVGLVNGHLGILVSVEKDEGRIGGINKENRAGELCYVREVSRLAAKKKVKSWNSNFQPMRRGLV